MAFGSLDFGSALSSFGGAVGDLFAAKGAGMSAAGFTDAAAREDLAAKYSTASTNLKEVMMTRKIEQTEGAQKSAVAGAGFQFRGSAIDMATDSAAQGALSQALIENQGAIDVQAHEGQAAAYRSEAAQAQNQQKADKIGGFLKIGLGILSLFSDKNLKHNIVKVGTDEEGKHIYEFSYIGSNHRWTGYIAQELDPKDVTDAAGVLGVNEDHRARLVA